MRELVIRGAAILQQDMPHYDSPLPVLGVNLHHSDFQEDEAIEEARPHACAKTHNLIGAPNPQRVLSVLLILVYNMQSLRSYTNTSHKLYTLS
jgi:hypothetical protein